MCIYTYMLFTYLRLSTSSDTYRVVRSKTLEIIRETNERFVFIAIRDAPFRSICKVYPFVRYHLTSDIQNKSKLFTRIYRYESRNQRRYILWLRIRPECEIDLFVIKIRYSIKMRGPQYNNHPDMSRKKNCPKRNSIDSRWWEGLVAFVQKENIVSGQISD